MKSPLGIHLKYSCISRCYVRDWCHCEIFYVLYIIKYKKLSMYVNYIDHSYMYTKI